MSSLVLVKLFVEANAVPLANQAADDTHHSTSNNENATILVPRFLITKL